MSETQIGNAGRGAALAFVCLFLLAALPVISNSRPAGTDALGFAFYLSFWQLLFSLPMFVGEPRTGRRGIFDGSLAPRSRRRVLAIILLTGTVFGLSTFVYVLAAEKAGAASTAVAMQAYPLFAILWESIFLRRRKSVGELAWTACLIGALYYLATGGTWRIAGFSEWFGVALIVPFLWSVAHVIIKEVLGRTPITPNQVVFFRLVVSLVFLGAVAALTGSVDALLAVALDGGYQSVAILMGGVYYAELAIWFYAVKWIDVSLASSITVPAPAVTLILAVLILGDSFQTHQIVALVAVIASVYGLLYAGKRKRARLAA